SLLHFSRSFAVVLEAMTRQLQQHLQPATATVSHDAPGSSDKPMKKWVTPWEEKEDVREKENQSDSTDSSAKELQPQEKSQKSGKEEVKEGEKDVKEVRIKEIVERTLVTPGTTAATAAPTASSLIVQQAPVASAAPC
ncbi:hypothetical protein PMAYCL1PPCAC_13801, partial [Pristionchus mayeri]